MTLRFYTIAKRFPQSIPGIRIIVVRFTPSRVPPISLTLIYISNMSNNEYILNCLIVILLYKNVFTFCNIGFCVFFQIKSKKFFGKILIIQNIYIY